MVTVKSAPNHILEEKKTVVIPRSGGGPVSRVAHFLKPISTCSIEIEPPPVSDLPSHSTRNPCSDWPFKTAFHGWARPSKDWNQWVGKMLSSHHSTWKQSGIRSAIIASTCEIKRGDDLLIALAQRWCSETNTFLFPWGEATITLEDVMVLGGYPVLGSPVFGSPPTLEATADLRRVEEGLNQARMQIVRTRAQKACQSLWMKHFTENESEFEHEAFLSMWLARFVLPSNSLHTIQRHVFPIAIQLARGTPQALAPAVLAHIYRDLSSLKQSLGSSPKSRTTCTLWAPLQLVQIWAWERFSNLRPRPNPVENGAPRSALWHNVKCRKVGDLGMALDTAKSFIWRTWVSCSSNLYRDEEERVLVGSDSGEDLQSLVRCLRVSELAGIDCVEQYLPNRVAMQFGMDQDVPGRVDRCNESTEIAWSNYSRPIVDSELYIPSRGFQSGVTPRYLKWWRSMHGFEIPGLELDGSSEAASSSDGSGEGSSRKSDLPGLEFQEGTNSEPSRIESQSVQVSSLIEGEPMQENEILGLKRCPLPSKSNEEDDYFAVSPGFPDPGPERGTINGDSSENDEITISELLSSKKRATSSNSRGPGGHVHWSVDSNEEDVVTFSGIEPVGNRQIPNVASQSTGDGTSRKIEPVGEKNMMSRSETEQRKSQAKNTLLCSGNDEQNAVDAEAFPDKRPRLQLEGDDHSPAGDLQYFLVSPITSVGGVVQMESLEENTNSGSEMRRPKSEAANVVVSNNGNGEENVNAGGLDAEEPGLQLEDRVSNLEKLFRSRRKNSQQ